jgi:transcription antitermination factor NusG
MGEACLSSNTFYRSVSAPLDSIAMQSQHLAWYPLKVRSGGELSAAAALRIRGFDPYCPTQKERRRYSDRMKLVEAAVFPGYVFCQFDIRRKLSVITSPGVEYIVAFADPPTPVPEEEIVTIRRVIDAGAQATPYLARGQRVRVTHGALEGVEGILVRDASGDRLVISIELVNQSASLHIDIDEVCPVGRTTNS